MKEKELQEKKDMDMKEKGLQEKKKLRHERKRTSGKKIKKTNLLKKAK